MPRFLHACSYVALALSSFTAANAHTTSVGYESAGPGSITLWYGTYHYTGFTEGSLSLVGQDVSFSATVPFTLLTATKPTGLIDGTTNFYTNGTQLTGTANRVINTWQGSTFNNLVAGTYVYTYIPISQPTQDWQPIDNVILSSSFTITAAILGSPVIDASRPSFNENDPAATASTITFDGGTFTPTVSVTLAQPIEIRAGGATIDTSTGDVVSNGDVTGSGGLVKSGSGTLTLNGASSYTGGTTVEAGRLVGSTTSLNGDIANSGTVEFAQASDGTYAGAVSGSGGLIKSGTGTLTLAGANSYTGGTTVEAGRLIGSITSLRGDIANSGTVEFAQASDGTYAGAVSGSGGLIKSGTGTLTLAGNNSYTGGTTIEAGRLVGSTTSLNGDIANSGTVEFAQASDGTYAGAVSGSGGLIKSGTGTLTLAGNNSYTGGTTIEAGRLVGSTTSLNGDIANSGTVEFAQASDGTYAGAVSGSGGLIKSGMGTLTLYGANSYTGGTTIEAGRLVGSTTSLNGDIANSGTVEFAQANDGTYAGAVSGNGGLVKSGAGTLTLTAANSYTGGTTIEAGRLDGNTASLNGDIVNSGTVEFAQATNGTYAGVVSGNGGLVKSGAGTLTLAGTNSYTGGTTIMAGRLIGSADTLRGDIANSATLEFAQASNGSYSGAISGSGALVKSGNGALTLSGANNYTGGTTVLAGRLVGTTGSLRGNIANSGTVEFAQATDGAFAGVITGSGTLVKSGNAALILSGTNEKLNASVVGGTLVVAGQQAIGSTGGAIVLGGGTKLAATADIVVSQSLTITGGAASIDTGANTVTLAGGGGGNACLVKNGSGRLILASQMGNSIGACVQQGTLSLNSTFNGNVYVDPTGTAGGSGLVNGDISVQGVLAPGNSPGQLTVAGRVTQQAGSTLALDIDGTTPGNGAGHFDTVVLTGVNAIYTAAGAVAPRTRGITGSATNSFTPAVGQLFQVVTAEGGVAGSFSSVVQPTTGLPANSRFDVIYRSNAILLAVTPNSYVATLGGSGVRNRVAVAQVLDAVRPAAGVRTAGASGALFDGLAGLGEAALGSTFEQLSGSIQASATDATLQASRAARGEIVERLSAADDASTGAGGRSTRLWGVANRPVSRIHGDETGLGYRSRGYSGSMGIDTDATQHLVLGAAGSYLDNKVATDGLGSARVHSYQGHVYAGWHQTGTYATGVMTFGVDRYHVRRAVALSTGTQSLSSSPDGFSFAANVEFGHRVPLGIAGITPLAGVAYDRVERDVFRESGSDQAALTFDKGARNAWTVRAGARVDAALPIAAGAIRPFVSAVAVRELDDRATTLTARLLGTPFDVSTAAAGRTAIKADAGVGATIARGVEVTAGYRYAHWSNGNARTATASLAFRW